MNHDFFLRCDDNATRLQCRMTDVFASRKIESVSDLAKNWNHCGDGQDAVFAFASRPMVEFAS